MDASATMRAVYLLGIGRLEERQVPIPRPGPREVLVAVKSVGVCGSDLHYYEHGRLANQVITEPLILGHECAGEVVELGPEVTTLAVGDRIALEMGVPCQRCEYCLGGRYNLCRRMVFKGTPPRNHGAFRQYMTCPEFLAHRLPDNVSYEMGATVEPLCVGLHAADSVELRPGERVAVLGAGPIGLLAIAVARAAGATDIAAVDPVPMRRELAKRMGAAQVFDPGTTDVAQALANSADVVMDCAGVQETLSQCLDIVRWGGRVAWVGVGCEEARLPLMKAMSKELRIVTVFRYAGLYKRAIRLLAEGVIDARPIVTHRFRFPRVDEALKFASENRDRAAKTMINLA
jgi:L-iditol 2-dehydrogenase